jgi:hypothetical protein
MIVLQAVLAAAMLGSSPGAIPLVAPIATVPAADSIRSDAVQNDTIPRRRHAVEYSEWYDKRLTIHRVASYTMLPLFGAEYVLGNQLMHGDESYKTAHVAVATGIGALFTVNTVTGVWNWWDSRSDPAGRTRRTLHALTMLASDAGFIWTGAIGDAAKRSNDNARRHRNVALGSIGVATVGTAMMWLWKD